MTQNAVSIQTIIFNIHHKILKKIISLTESVLPENDHKTN